MKEEVRVSKKLNCHFVARTCRSWQNEVENEEEFFSRQSLHVVGTLGPMEGPPSQEYLHYHLYSSPKESSDCISANIYARNSYSKSSRFCKATYQWLLITQPTLFSLL